MKTVTVLNPRCHPGDSAVTWLNTTPDLLRPQVTGHYKSRQFHPSRSLLVLISLRNPHSCPSYLIYNRSYTPYLQSSPLFTTDVTTRYSLSYRTVYHTDTNTDRHCEVISVLMNSEVEHTTYTSPPRPRAAAVKWISMFWKFPLIIITIKIINSLFICAFI